MNINPINYNNTTMNKQQQTFGAAQFTTLPKLADDLQKVLRYKGVTNEVIDCLDIEKMPGKKIAGEFLNMEIGGNDVSIETKLVKKGFLHTVFDVKSKPIDFAGEGESTFTVYNYTKSGKRIAKKIVRAAEEATSEIIESIAFLKAKAENVANKINQSGRHGGGKMTKNL